MDQMAQGPFIVIDYFVGICT